MSEFDHQFMGVLSNWTAPPRPVCTVCGEVIVANDRYWPARLGRLAHPICAYGISIEKIIQEESVTDDGPTPYTASHRPHRLGRRWGEDLSRFMDVRSECICGWMRVEANVPRAVMALRDHARMQPLAPADGAA